MDIVVTKYQSHLLPEDFWKSLFEIRNYLILNDEFVQKIYNPTNPGHSRILQAAFDLVDCTIDTEWFLRKQD